MLTGAVVEDDIPLARVEAAGLAGHERQQINLRPRLADPLRHVRLEPVVGHRQDGAAAAVDRGGLLRVDDLPVARPKPDDREAHRHHDRGAGPRESDQARWVEEHDGQQQRSVDGEHRPGGDLDTAEAPAARDIALDHLADQDEAEHAQHKQRHGPRQPCEAQHHGDGHEFEADEHGQRPVEVQAEPVGQREDGLARQVAGRGLHELEDRSREHPRRHDHSTENLTDPCILHVWPHDR